MPSRTILEACTARALTFLEALGTRPELRATMAVAGYSDDDHAQGWSLLHTAAGFGSRAKKPANKSKAAEARRLLLEWDRRARPLVKAALRTSHPIAYKWLFESQFEFDLGFAIAFVERWKNLDASARATLERRGFGGEARKSVAAWLTALQTLDTRFEPPADRTPALYDLYKWLSEWSDVAHAVVERRDELIQLGIAKRRRS
jgi:hypothetical protein